MSEQPFPGATDDADATPVEPRSVEPGDDAAAEAAAAGAAGGVGVSAPGRVRPDLEPCQFPGGCANTMEYAGSGRRPKYCYQIVGGVMHDRANAKRIADGGVPARRRAGAARPTTSSPGRSPGPGRP